ncbi:two-component system sensor histidine kinase NtrB [Nitratireductor pacificus]|uniref:histidine kinase n=1 Tax=Nitratireductor pacificus pht-3B TaxID=391937 RepID=K2M6C0_9HYPH|nr:ATP-binding protein [Nitratireductor pacificus]EKF17671.1 two component sensor kinase [Nitratireductor pacificus pht-3B]
MKDRSFFSSIAFRLPFVIIFICGLVLGLSLIAIHGLTSARMEMTSYGSSAFASLAKASTISRRISALLSAAPFLPNSTSPYRLSSESLEVAKQIDELTGFIRSRPPGGSADPEEEAQTGKVLALLLVLRRETLSLAEIADEAQDHKAMATAQIARIEAERDERYLDPQLGDAFHRIALSAAASESLLHLGEMRRRFLQASAPVRADLGQSEAEAGRAGFLAAYEHLFEMRKRYLARLSAIRSTVVRLRSASQQLAAAMEAQTVRTGETLSAGFETTSQTLNRLRGMIVLALLLVMALSVYAIRSAVRISQAITRISNGMEHLTRGDRDAEPPRFDGSETELRKLVRAFASFKASVDRVSRLRGTAETAARTIRSTFRSMNEGIAIFDRTGRPITMNHRIIALMRAPTSARKLKARHFVSGIAELDPGLLPHGEEDAGTLRAPTVIRSRGTGARVLEISLSRQPGERVVMLVRDVTEAEQQEQEARRAQRLDGLMLMTHQVSHEVGNMIGVITGSLGMLEKAGRLDDGQQRHLARIRKAAERGKSLASSMLSVASQQALAPSRVDVGSLLHGMADILEMAVGPRCTVRLDVRKPLPAVCLDPAVFEQAVFNLCINAAAAMPEGGEITIDASARRDVLAVEVRDRGVGMAAEVVDRAFEPYFTTRRAEGGTGLGLAVVYGFVRQSGGTVSIRSRPGKGTRVEMLFPTAPHPADNASSR